MDPLTAISHSIEGHNELVALKSFCRLEQRCVSSCQSVLCKTHTLLHATLCQSISWSWERGLRAVSNISHVIICSGSSLISTSFSNSTSLAMESHFELQTTPPPKKTPQFKRSCYKHHNA